MSIDFKGLERTDTSYILRFLTATEGESFDSLSVVKDIQELQNLQLFYDVQATVIDTLGQVKIVYSLKEVKARLPIIGLGWTNSVFWSELGGIDLNVLGKGIQLMVKHRFYQRNSYLFYLKNPHFKSSRWGYEVQVGRLSTIEPLYFTNTTQFYDYDNNSVGVGVFYWLLKKNSLRMYAQYIHENYQRNLKHTSDFLEGPGKHQTNKMLYKLSNTSNYVNYSGVRLNGFSNYLSLESIQSKNVYERFVKVSNELKVFKYIGEFGDLALRLRTGVSTNSETPFSSFVADNYVNIRGIGDRAVRGTAEVALNVEYRQFLFTKKSVSVSGVGFVDFGSWRTPGGKFSVFQKDAVAYSGVGTRLHLLKYYNAILRVDYSFSLKDFNNNGIIIGVGQYF